MKKNNGVIYGHSMLIFCIMLCLCTTLSAQNTGRYPLQTIADAYVDQGSSNMNFGDQPHLYVGKSPEFGYNYRIFLKFDLTPLPGDAVVQSADLYMYMFDSEGVSPVTFRFSTIKESWDESTINYENKPETYNPFLYVDVDDVIGWKIFDIKQVVRGWIKGTNPNNGIQIIAVDAGNTIFQRNLYSTESPNCGAYVLVTYTTAGTPPTPPDIPSCQQSADHTPPTLTIIANPNPATTADVVHITAEAADDGSGVYRVQLLRGGTIVNDITDASGPATLSAEAIGSLAAGIHGYSAIAYDREMNGISASVRIQVYQDGRPPTVHIRHTPPNPAIGDPVDFIATAQDESGVTHLSVALNENVSDYHYSPADNSITETVGYSSPRTQVMRYRASATDEEGFYSSTGTKYILFGNDGPDSDGDHLSDAIEDMMGLDPFSNDTDHDGLYDHWEVLGFDADGDGDIDVDLPEMGASPHQKDMFLEIDWMEDAQHSHMLHPWAIQYVQNVYRDYGINLHVDVGQYGGGNALTHQEVITDCVNTNELAWLLDTKADNFDRNRCGIFYYCAVLHTYPCGSKSLGTANIILRTGDYPICYSSDPSHCNNDYFSPARQAMLLFHELGHAVGLGHGGIKDRTTSAQTLGPDGTLISETLITAMDDENDKPNYFSTMNYRYQWDLKIRTDDGDTVFVLAYNNLDSWLDEANLDEPDGFVARANIGSYLWRREGELWFMYQSLLQGDYFVRPMKAEYRDGRGRPLTAWFRADGSPIDWNFDGDDDDIDLSYDTNEHQNDADEWVVNITNLHAPNEIPHLRPKIFGDIYAGFTLAKSNLASLGNEEEDFNYPDAMSTTGEYCDGIDNDGDGVIDEGFPDRDGDHIQDMIDNAPFIANADQADANRNFIGDAAEVPPGEPRSFWLGIAGKDATMKWGSPSPSSQIIGYNVYRRTCKEKDFKRLGPSFPTTLETGYDDSDFSSGLCGKNAAYEYAVSAVDIYMREGKLTDPLQVIYSDVKQMNGADIPRTFALSQNYPNPFNPVTHLHYQLPRACQVSLKVYNDLGQEIAVLVDEQQAAGYYNEEWDAARVVSGLYFYRLEAKEKETMKTEFVKVIKMLLIK